jgi:putative Mg2+ transporter-C (MgtC) family protein
MAGDLVPLFVSLAFGTLLGWERQLGHKPAGLRTHALVCVGTTLFVLVGRHAVESAAGAGATVQVDPTRVIHGIVTGIGFLGAGSILRQRDSVFGLTTAASIWYVAAVGVAVGVRAYLLAVVGTAIGLVVLEGFRWLERRLTAGRENQAGSSQ